MNAHLQAWDIAVEDFPADGFAADQLEFLLGYAILAPSIHNTQPWLFRLHTTDVEVFADPRRSLPVVDPYGRQRTLSCGAALFNLRVAAEYFGHAYQLETFPDPAQPHLLARLHLGLRCETGSEDVLLFQAIPERRTNREPFSPEPLSPEVSQALEAAAEAEGAWLHLVRDDEGRNALADLVAEADLLQWSDKQFREELATWVRLNPEHQRDGIPLGELGVRNWLASMAPLLIRTFNRGAGQAAKDREIAQYSPALAVLGTAADTPAAWLAAGQALEHVLLRARGDDLSASFLNQPIEVSGLRDAVQAVTGREGFPQVLLRLGHGPAVIPTPRRSVREVLLRHQGIQAR